LPENLSVIALLTLFSISICLEFF